MPKHKPFRLKNLEIECVAPGTFSFNPTIKQKHQKHKEHQESDKQDTERALLYACAFRIAGYVVYAYGVRSVQRRKEIAQDIIAHLDSDAKNRLINAQKEYNSNPNTWSATNKKYNTYATEVWSKISAHCATRTI